jgi:hypothetical protein
MDGFKFGVGFVLGKAFLVVVSKAIIKAAEKIDNIPNENE